MNEPHADQFEIERTFRLCHHPGEPFEVRFLKIPPRNGRGKEFTASGYFDDYKLAAKAVADFDNEWKPAGSYHVLNVINPALFARSPNKITLYAKDTTEDADIVLRRWSLVDLDPVRPTGISSSQEELDAAIAASEIVREFLRKWGFPEPVHAISGNGVHLLTPLELPNDDASRTACRSLLDLLAKRAKDFNQEGKPTIGVDVGVFNAARICRIYGTVARKGHSIPDRPHRVSQLTYIPDCLPGGSVRYV